MKPHVSRVTALFLLCQVFLIITHIPLVRVLAWIILAGDAEIFTEKGAAKISRDTARQVGGSDARRPPLLPSLRHSRLKGEEGGMNDKTQLDEAERSPRNERDFSLKSCLPD
jgi:hypothetical protein